MHVLVILTDITNYADALREISAAKKEVPAAAATPATSTPTLAICTSGPGRELGKESFHYHDPHSDHARGRQNPPYPRPDRLYHGGRQIILSRDLFRQSILPPVDVLPSLSRLKDKGVGAGKTREDHSGTMNQLFAAYASGKEDKELMTILGEAALSPTDLLYAKFADE